jgi:DNA-binding CsgD family transcriptional regulator
MMPAAAARRRGDRTAALSALSLRSVLDHLALAIFIFRRERLVYMNTTATRLVDRLRNTHRIELLVMLHDHLAELRERSQHVDASISLTAHDNEPFVVHVFELEGSRGDVAVSVREIGTDVLAFGAGYRLSRREIQVVELVLRGHRNSEIASTLGVAPATIKKHLSRIFDKVGVTSRAQLTSKLA